MPPGPISPGSPSVMNDQRAYAKAVRRLISDLDLDPGAEDLEADDSERSGRRRFQAGRPQRGQGRGRGEGFRRQRRDGRQRGRERPGGMPARADSAETDMEMKGEGGEDSPNRPGRPPESDPRKRGQNEPQLSPLHRGVRRDRRGGRSLRPRRARPAAPAPRPAADASADRGRPARQPAAAPPAGQAEPELGIRPRGRDARRGPPAARRGQSRDAALLQARARYRIPRHGGDAC